MKLINLSRLWLVGTLVLGIVFAFPHCVPGQITDAMTVSGASQCDPCNDDGSEHCSEIADGDDEPCPEMEEVQRCTGTGDKYEDYGSEKCRHKECYNERYCTCHY